MKILHNELGAKECENRIQNLKIEYEIKNDGNLKMKFEVEV